MRLAVITHPNDPRLRTGLDGYLQRSKAFYQIDAILLAGRWHGLRWFFTDPTQPFRNADAAILHVDTSLIPQDYLDLAARYPVAINGRVADIRKRHVSRNLLDRMSNWVGPVLVKSDLNCGGKPERRLARKAADQPVLAGEQDTPSTYTVHDSLAAVPEVVWQDPTRVVERFLPEKRGPDNVLRVWSFLGKYERCNWYSAPDAIIKAGTINGSGPSPVPDALRAERARLGFDYGKLDFAIGPDGPVLFDANRTPAYLHQRPAVMRAAAQPMAQALIKLIGG